MFNPGMANMQGMMKKVQKMQQEMLKLQEKKYRKCSRKC